jgi:SAM-dependent methyltransferase
VYDLVVKRIKVSKSAESLTDYLVRSRSLLERSSELQAIFGSEVSPEFLDWVDTRGIILQRELQDVGVAFPPWKEMLTVGGETNLELFLSIGLDTFKWVEPFLPTSGEHVRVLDFGIGCARTARHFFRQSNQMELYGCDVDRNAVEWVANNLSFVRSYVSNTLPPLIFSRNYFDCIYSISVFSHLNREYFVKWLDEMHRCLKLGGSLILTYHGPSAFEKIEKNKMSDALNISNWDYRGLREKLTNEKFVWLGQKVGSTDIDEKSYGISFTNVEFIQEVSANKFAFFQSVSEVGGWQDLIVLKKI